MSKRRDSLIVFSGLDGAGKSTQINLLMDQLRAQGKQPTYLWTRGGYTSGMEKSKALIRRILHGQVPASGHSEQRTQTLGKSRVRSFWLSLAILDLIRVYALQIRWWRLQGRSVICDRYLWDTCIDFRLNFGNVQSERWWLWRFLVRITPQPDAAFLLLIPVEESVRRSKLKNEPFPDSVENLTRRLEAYETFAKRNYWQVFDGRQPIAEINEAIKRIALDQHSE